MTDEAGLAAERSTYRPFGEEAEQLLSLSTPKETKGYIGERFDDTSGLQYLNARYYDPKLGLFIQPDWWEVTKAGVGTNRYSYSFNDPVNRKDPSGNVNAYLGGALDDTGPDDPMGQFKEDFEKDHPSEFDSKNGLDPLSDNWQSTTRGGKVSCESGESCDKKMSKMAKAIMDILSRYPDENVNILGHSRGAAAAVRLANELHELGVHVDNLVTLDPVSRKGTGQKLADDTTNWTNISIASESRIDGMFTGPGPVNPDWIAKVGGAWGSQPEADYDVELTDWYGRSVGYSGHMAVVDPVQVRDILDRLGFGE